LRRLWYAHLVSQSEELIRSVLGLSCLVLRRDWLTTKLTEVPTAELGETFDGWLRAALAAHPAAMAALPSLVVTVVWPCNERWMTELRRLAFERRWLGLARLLRTYPMPQGLLEPPAGVPLYDPSRELTLGERRSLARAIGPRTMEKFLSDPSPMVVRELLRNPRLTEENVVRMVARRPPRPSNLLVLAETPNWLIRPRVRMALLQNPGTPSALGLPLLALATRPELESVAESPSLHVVLRATADEYLGFKAPSTAPELTHLH